MDFDDETTAAARLRARAIAERAAASCVVGAGGGPFSERGAAARAQAVGPLACGPARGVELIALPWSVLASGALRCAALFGVSGGALPKD